MSHGFSEAYWLYLAAGALIAAGFADFSLIAFHFQKTATVSQGLIPVFYAAAMATGAIASLILGRLLDKVGLPILGVPAFFAVFVFLRQTGLEFVGMILWGIGMGAQDSCLKAVLSHVVPSEKRSTAFGIFDTGFGIAWFAGSAVMGVLYDKSLAALVGFSLILQLLALPFLVLANRREGA
jgi:predicted MFS family arabinose efflux permease